MTSVMNDMDGCACANTRGPCLTTDLSHDPIVVLVVVVKQIRVGDFVFKDSGSEKTIKLDDYMDFFDCATEIEKHKRRSADTKVRWLFGSLDECLTVTNGLTHRFKINTRR